MAALVNILVAWTVSGTDLVAPGRVYTEPGTPPPTPSAPWFYLDDPGSPLDGTRKLA